MASEESEVRKGPWTLEEDRLLLHYIACHGEGRWNLLARSSGLRRTGKSCRLRWLNYLKPDVKRGNLSPQEQLLILELHSRWGNRWSKIAQHLPGRTDNEIKNYWRTRVQKQARQLKIDANSARFRDTVRLLWMPRLLHQMQSSSSSSISNQLNQLDVVAPPVLLQQQSSPINMNGNNKPIPDQSHHGNHTTATSGQMGATQVLEMSEISARSCPASSNYNLVYDPFVVGAHHVAGATWDQPTPSFDHHFTCSSNLGPATSGSAIHVEDGSGLDCYLSESDWMSFDQDDLQIMRLQL